MREPLTISTPTIVRGVAWIVAAALSGVWIVRLVGSPLLPPPDPPSPLERSGGAGPTVHSIVMGRDGAVVDRVEVDHAVMLVASVQESRAVSRLEFIWTAPVGEIRGSGPSVAWWVPKGTRTPVEVVSSLEVVERYPDFETGLTPEMRELRVRVDGPALQVNDSRAELTRMARTFLVDLFGNSSVSPEACLVDFSDTCRGKEDELADIQINRRMWRIHSARADVTRIEFDPSMNSALVTARCTFKDVERETGREHITEADCMLTAVHLRPRWWLCGSYTTNGSHRYLSEPASGGGPSASPAVQ